MNCKNILIIEDEEDIREALKEVLEIEGYTVLTAANGREGLDRLREIRKPCLVLLDLMMPVMDGWKFLECQKADESIADNPVVVVSAAGDKAQSTKAHGFIKKPIDIEVLLKVVQNFCGLPDRLNHSRKIL